MFEKTSWYKELPDKSLSIYEPNLKLFFETMWERQRIWKLRFIDNLPQPWTKDKIFQESKFTNVYRDLDRNSQWEIKNIILDDELDLKNLIWKIMVFRFFNNPETFTFIPQKEFHQKSLFQKENLFSFPNNSDLISCEKWRNGIPDFDNYKPKEFLKYIKEIRDEGKNPFTSAYLIYSKVVNGKSRDYYYTNIILPELHKKLPELINLVLDAKTPEEIIKFLKTLPGVADFIAHEFYQDFTYIDKYTNRKFMKFDQNDFTNVGPGSSTGIRLIYPNLQTVKEQKQAIYNLRDIAEEWLNKISEEKGEPMHYLYWDKTLRKYYISDKCNITLHQIEMWLCEFQKYWKMIIGIGKQRSNFIPKTKKLIM